MFNRTVQTSLMTVAALLIATLVSVPQADAQDGSRASGSARRSSLVCTMSAFFAIDPVERHVNGRKWDGRGLASCENDQGFTSDVPVLVELEAEIIGGPKDIELALSGNTPPFVVSREVAQLQDHFAARTHSWQQGGGSHETAVLLRGDKNDLVLEMKLTSRAVVLPEIKVTGIRIRIDESAPDLY